MVWQNTNRSVVAFRADSVCQCDGTGRPTEEVCPTFQIVWIAMPENAAASCAPTLFGLARVTIPSTTMDYTAITLEALIRACAEGKAAAWQEFIRRFHRIITVTAFRAARRWGDSSPAVVDDVTQETYLKLCADRAHALCEFDSPEPDAMFAFLKVVTTNVANDYFKRLRARKRGGSQACESLEEIERQGRAAGSAVYASVERTLLINEVEECLSQVAPAATRERDCMIFWLYFRQGLTAKEIAGLPSVGLSLKGVESTLHRLIQLVRNHLVERGSVKSHSDKIREKEFGSGSRT